MTVALGIDIGGTNTKIAVVGADGTVLGRASFATEGNLPFASFLQNLERQVDALLTTLGLSLSRVQGVGVGCPNTDARSGMLCDPPNLSWGTLDLVALLTQAFDRPVLVANDADVAACGEKRWGLAQGLDDFVVMTLGTGVGTGLFIGGGLHVGLAGTGAEGGHIVVEPGGRRCNCGGHGHLECYASVRGIKQTLLEWTGSSQKFRSIAQCFYDGDEVYVKAFAQTARYLGRGLATIGSLLAPQAIILAGGIAMVGESFRQQVEDKFNEQIFAPLKGRIPIQISEVAREYGAVLGAASLVFMPESLN